ncbi:hypothetical protein B9Z55_007180 [Caenorhabditis nigoni]|uniref:BRCT domain-containing protein n=1 Tax=Caenorhabditis nigoni TaxID=1611254 RepID=A0A2G5V8J2_9PELO|nr:hypothetical protein B9Z55_007180 [Caenorhabditis nigoni]
MQLSNCSLYTGVAIIGIAICLILTSTTSNNESDRLQIRLKKENNENKLLRDHWNLARLFQIIHLNCGLLSGEVNSNDTIDKFWNLSKPISASKLASIDLKKFSRGLERVSNSVNSTSYHPIGDIDYKLIDDGLLAIKQARLLQDISDSLKKIGKPGNISEILEEVRFWRWSSYYDWTENSLRLFETLEKGKEINGSTLSEISRLPIERAEINDIRQYESLLPLKDDFSTIQKIATASLNLTVFNETFLKSSSEQIQLAQLPFYATQNFISQLKHSESLHRAVQLSENVISSLSSLSSKNSSSSSILSEIRFSQTMFQVQYDENFLKVLESAIEPIHKFIGGLSKFDNRLGELGKGWLETIHEIDRFLKLREKVYRDRLLIEKSIKFHNCLHSIDPESSTKFSSFENLPQKLQTWNDFVRILMAGYETFLSFKVNSEDITSYEDIRTEIHRLRSQTSTDVSSEIAKILKSPKYPRAKVVLTSFRSILALLKDKKFSIDAVEKAWAELNDFQEAINSTQFHQMNPICDENNFKFEAFNDFVEFHKLFGKLKKENSFQELDRQVIRPLRRAQIEIRALTEISNRMNKHPKSYNIYCNELCGRMKRGKGLLLDFQHGVEFLEKLFDTFKQKENIKKLVTYSDVVKIAAEDTKVRSDWFYQVKDYFQWIKGNESEIEKTFQKIRNLETMHNTESWTNLSSISKIYETADKIKSPIDFERVHELMDVLLEETNSNDPKLEEAFNLTRDLAQMMTGLKLEHVAFHKSIKSLKELQPYFDKFYEWSKPKPASNWKKIRKYILKIGIPLLLMIGTLAFLINAMKDKKRKRTITPEDRLNDPDFILTDENKLFWPQLLQTARLSINKRDENGYTKLYLAVEQNNFEEAKSLIEQGAALDAACGPKYRTALQQAAERGNQEMADLLLKNGADRKCYDAYQKSAKRLCSPKNFTKAAFARNYDNRHKVILPKVKRDFYVLIVERSRFLEDYLENLPPALEVVYGYKEGEVDLGDFTHFVMSSRSEKSKDLELDLNKMLAFEIVTKPGMIVSMDWLFACMEDPDQVDYDWKYLLTDITFEKKTHKNVLTKMKNDMHRLRPPLFHGCEIMILQTRNRIMDTDRDIWIRIIQNLGGKFTTHPYPADPELIPYHHRADESSDQAKLYNSIVLYFGDSVILERWTWPENCISLIGMGWLPESIVRYQLIRPDDHCLRNEKDFNDLAMIYEQGCIANKDGD